MLRQLNCVLVALLLVTHSFSLIEGKRFSTSNRKSSSSSSSGHVTRPSYSSGNSGSSHAHDNVRLSYPSQNAAPSGGVHNAPPIGWNVPKQQGPPPAYSPSNPVGGAKTNVHEAPPAYHGNNAPPPSYGAATGSNIHTPISPVHSQGVQSSYPSQQMPAGATYYPSGGYHPPAGATYYPSGGYHGQPGGYPSGHYGGGNAPAGATYLPAGASLPPGAVMYSQPPSSSSGLGFGSGLAAGAIGGAILGHVLTPTQTRVVEQVPANGAGSSDGGDRIIIINNGAPGSVNATEVAPGTTVINTGSVDPSANATAPEASAPLAPLAPMNPVANENGTTPNGDAAAAPPPPPGGIICVPMRINETDPNDSTKVVEVEKIACYPAPPQPEPQTGANNENLNNNNNMEGKTPLAPINTAALPENSIIQKSNGATMMKFNYVQILILSSTWLILTFRDQF